MEYAQLKEKVTRLIKLNDFQELSNLFSSVKAIDVADTLINIDDEKLILILNNLPAIQRANLFPHLQSLQIRKLVSKLPQETITSLLENLQSDEAVDLFNLMNNKMRDEVLQLLNLDLRDNLVQMSVYKEGTVGSQATSEYATVSPNIKVIDALESLRKISPTKQSIYVVYVLDENRHLIGTVSLRDLLVANPNSTIRSIMVDEPVFVKAEWESETAAEMINRYNLLAVPVINNSNKMIGIVTLDDARSIAKETDAATLTKFGAAGAIGSGDDLDIISSPWQRILTVRSFWLVLLTVFGIFTSTFVAGQEEILENIVILAAFIPAVIDMGGNTGSQSATLVIRSMALGQMHMRWKDVFFVIKREIPVVIMLGIIVSVVEAVLAIILKGEKVTGNFNIIFVVISSMFVCTVLGGIVGATLPFLARLMKTDPATLSSPLITSIMDFVGVIIYFGFAWLFLAGNLDRAKYDFDLPENCQENVLLLLNGTSNVKINKHCIDVMNNILIKDDEDPDAIINIREKYQIN